MSLTKAVRNYLLANSDVKAAIGTRFFADILPQKDGRITTNLPACTQEKVSGARESDLSGGIGLARTRLSITVYAATRSQSDGLADTISTALLRMRGMFDGIHVRCVTSESEPIWSTDPPIDASDKWRYLTTCDFELTHGVAVSPLAI